MATSRGKNYSSEELKQLCLSVLHISQDPCVGAGQRKETFWDRVTDHYEKHKPRGSEFRGRKSLEGKWSEIKHDVAKFIGYFEQVADLKLSGTNADDTFEKAKELFKENHPKKKSFAFGDCYGILKDSPRWMPAANEMAKGKGIKIAAVEAQASEKGKAAANSAENELGEPDDGDSCIADQTTTKKRPQGTKNTKEVVKKQKQAEDAFKMSALAQKEMAATNKERVQILQDNSLMNLLAMPTHGMDLELQDFMKTWKLEQVAKLKERMQSRQQPKCPSQPTVPTVPPVLASTLNEAANEEEDNDGEEDDDNEVNGVASAAAEGGF
ncbi:unnamed protein product [Calypogeia fissa]